MQFDNLGPAIFSILYIVVVLGLLFFLFRQLVLLVQAQIRAAAALEKIARGLPDSLAQFRGEKDDATAS